MRGKNSKCCSSSIFHIKIAGTMKMKLILKNTREIALMIQLEQQQHGEFWVGWWVGWVGNIPTTYIQLTLWLDQYECLFLVIYILCSE